MKKNLSCHIKSVDYDKIYIFKKMNCEWIIFFTSTKNLPWIEIWKLYFDLLVMFILRNTLLSNLKIY